MSKAILTLLHLNAWIAFLIGGLIVLSPISMLSAYGFQSEISTGLMSELRAPGGLLIVCGLLILRSALSKENYQQGLQVSIMVYGGYGGARLLGFALDGQPPLEILLATAIELILCTLSIAAMRTNHRLAKIAFAR